MVDCPLNRTKVKRGMDLPQSKLTDDDVRLIRGLIDKKWQYVTAAKSLSNAKIAEKFGVHVRTIDGIASGERWGHVD